MNIKCSIKKNFYYLLGCIYQIKVLSEERQSTTIFSPSWVVRLTPHCFPFLPSFITFSIWLFNSWDGAKLISSKNSSSILIKFWLTIEDTIFVELSTFPTVLWPNIRMYVFFPLYLNFHCYFVPEVMNVILCIGLLYCYMSITY